ncbi:S-layer homology domain-containing protein [Phascolarctobacterium sp.]
MKKSLVLAMAMALGVTASAYAANPFSDVPAGHWAYDSINKLAAAGIVDGYGDSTFGGDRLMTRYEMAQIVAKAMAKGANVDRLAAEFADELDSLGVRVAALEKKSDNVKITGEVRYHYADHSKNDAKYDTKLRSRIFINGQINDDWKYTGMLENNENLKDDAGVEKVVYQRAYVNGKLGGVAVQAGRYNLKLADGNVYDTRFDGVQFAYGKDIKLTAGYGKATPSTLVRFDSDETLYVDLTGKVGALELGAGYYDFKNLLGLDVDDSIFQVNANYAFTKDLKLGAMYLKGDADHSNLTKRNSDDDGFVVSLGYKGAKAAVPGSWGLAAKYYDQGAATYIDHTMNGRADEMFGFKGYGLTANYTFAKNIVGQVEYYDLKDKETDLKSKTLWSQVVFTF